MGKKVPFITIHGISVDQPSFRNFGDRIHKTQICETVPQLIGSEKRLTYSKKTGIDHIVACYLNKMDLTHERKPPPFKTFTPTNL